MSGSLISIDPGMVGAVVTYLEMRVRPPLPPVPESSLRLERWDPVDPARFRALFRRVGGKWLWFSRLAMDDATLLAKTAEVNAVIAPDGEAVGLLELDFRTASESLIRFLGLAPEYAGQGHGKWLFAETLARSWRADVRRVRVHTCTLDHPAALPSYLRAGFKAYARAFESFPDPRLAGLLPRDAAPQVPILDG
ncbi:GNAT family N-acetyltransferase [Sphingosinicella sp. LHD-64]|uniref:GNAT family N-acetyltransferase n=1 Tax=Sphingosinicella sp. LHD-64 TaxID=3072139 RepID=UPI00280DE1D5|nr:GNAT family N-acetyltransferase [Sphingosinicella sp. LHD-64]MDQ8755471.1 GNAT family N-acetyltransferase [Sphingosinicella sp. LHD-64]